MSHSVLVHSLKDLGLCHSCAAQFEARVVDAATPLVVSAFAQFLQTRARTPSTEPCRIDSGRQFWEELRPFRDCVDALDIEGALTELLDCAPQSTGQVVD